MKCYDNERIVGMVTVTKAPMHQKARGAVVIVNSMRLAAGD